MKKNQALNTLSVREQMVIIHWYSTTQKLLCVLIMLLTACSITYWYVQSYYMHSCSPAISAAYAETIAKKHAAHALCTRNQQQKEAELHKSSAILTNYANIINLHTEFTHNAQLTELKLSPQDVTAHYTVTNRNCIQSCIDKLRESSALEKVSLESIEQKSGTITCAIHSLWKKEEVR